MRFERRRPCGNCPFRKEAPIAHWDPREYLRLERIERLEGNPGQGGFACHKDRTKPYADREMCIGWLLDQKRKGMPAIALRVILIDNPEAISQYEECEPDGEMYSSVSELVRTNLARDKELHPERYRK